MSDKAKNMRKQDIFLSYAGEDRESIAKPLVRSIRCAGLSVWYDEIDSPLKKEEEHSLSAVAKMLHDSIISCSQAWLLIGPSYLAKQWTQYEALSLSALSICGIADLGVIYHSISNEELQSVLNELRLDIDCESNKVIRYENDPQQITTRLLSFVQPRVLMVMQKHPGPIDIAVMEQAGQVFLFTNGGFGSNKEEIVTSDFWGHRIGKEINMNGLLGTYLEPLPGESQDIEVDTTALARIELTGTVTIGFMNHPNSDLYTAEEINLGVVHKFGDLFFIPALTWGAFTIGQVTDNPSQLVKECIKIIEDANIDEWSMICFSKDGAFKVV